MLHVSRYLLILALLALFVGACNRAATPPTGEPEPDLGATRLRPADQETMLFVPGGTFQMGSDRAHANDARHLCNAYLGDLAIGVCRPDAYSNEMPAHSVTLEGFWLDRTEVTNGQYRACVEAGNCSLPAELGSHTRESYFADDAFLNYPVIWVTWQQAADYCAWAGVRLPTEAEWEYAARGPDNRVFPWGDDFDGRRLNYCDASCPMGVRDPAVDDGHPDTAPVGSFPEGVSWSGALDMAGNVREWVADWYGLYSPGAQSNPNGPASGSAHIPRGGSWLDRPDDTRGANRGENEINYVRHKVGFRCAADGP